MTLTSVRPRLLRGSAWVLSGKVGTIALGLLINGLLARLLPPEEFGAYFTILSLVAIGSTLAQLGLERSVVRLVSAALATGQPGRARHAVRIALTYGTLGAIVVSGALVLGLGHWLADHVYHSSLIASLIPVATGWLVVVALQSLLDETCRGFQWFGLATLFDSLLVDLWLVAVFGVLFLMRADVSVYEVIAVSALLTAFAALLAAGLIARRLRTLADHGRLLRGDVFQLAWPFLITNLSIYVLGVGADVWVLGFYRSQTDVALYAAAARLMLVIATPFAILSAVVPPIISELYAQGRRGELERSLRAVATLAGIPAFIGLMVFLLFGNPVMGLLYGPFYRQGATVLAILSVARLVAVWTGSCGVTLMMTGHQRQMMYISVFSGLASVAGDILAAPHFGRVGVAVATGTAQIMQNVLQLVSAKKLAGVWTFAQLSPRRFLQFLFGKTPTAPVRPSR